MSGCRWESACYTSTDRLTSGRRRLLTDTKETGALAHSLSHIHSHSGKWSLFFIYLFFSFGWSVHLSESLVVLSIKAKMRAFTATAGVCAATRSALFSHTKDVQQSLLLSPPLHSFLFVSVLHVLSVRFWLDLLLGAIYISGGEVASESNMSRGLSGSFPQEVVVVHKSACWHCIGQQSAPGCKSDQYLKANKSPPK